MVRPSPVPPCARVLLGVDLLELLENRFQLVGGNADAGVGHGNVNGAVRRRERGPGFCRAR